MKIYEVKGVGKLHGMTVLSLDAFVSGVEPEKEVDESDISGLLHAARNYNRAFLITADLAEGGRKTYRVKAQSEQVAREKFAKHFSMAKIVSVKEEGVAEGLSEMDNRTLSGDRREQRASSPEEKARREKEQQERLKQLSPEMRKKLRLPEPKEKGVAEGTSNIGNKIKALYQKIYDQGDDSIDYMYHESPVFAQYWDEYEGDLDSIVAEVDPSELQVIANELEAYLQGPGLAEAVESGGPFGPHPKTGKFQAWYRTNPKDKEIVVYGDTKEEAQEKLDDALKGM